MDKLRIGIDCRMAGLQHAGIGRYVENLVRELIPLVSQEKLVLFFTNAEQAEAVLGTWFDSDSIEIVYVPIRHYSLAEQVLLPLYLYRAKLDLLHVPHFNAPLLYLKPLLITIHDLLWHEQKGTSVTTLPAWIYWLKYAAYRVIVAGVLNHAQLILTPAETVAQTVRSFAPNAAKKLAVVKEGVTSVYLDSFKQTEATRKLLVYTGSLYPHKNVKLLIDALSELPNYSVALVGSRSVFQESMRAYVAQKGLEKRVQFLGFLDDQALIKLYHSATALVFPTLSEGFGLPGVEAMAVGLPVLASDIPILRETYHDAALFFDPLQVSALVSTVHKLEKADRKIILQKGKKVAATYSWANMAQGILTHYRKLNANNGHVTS